MSDLMVIVTEDIPNSLRGRLALWLVEIRSGVYVGVYSVKVREYIWDTISMGIRGNRGNVVMAWQDRNDLGLSIKSIGKSNWKLQDFDGLLLMGWNAKEGENL